MSPHPSPEPGVWVAAFLTLCIFSFLYRDNPFYKFAEHLFVGISAGYYIALNFWTVIVPNLWEPLRLGLAGHGVRPEHSGPFAVSLGDYRVLLVLPLVFGALLFTRLFGRVGWLSRWPLAVILGVYAGIKTTGFAQGDFVAQVQASPGPPFQSTVTTTLQSLSHSCRSTVRVIGTSSGIVPGS